MQGLLDSTTTTNRLAMLRLGSTTTMDDDSNGTVIFSDPCSCCGSMKRLRSSSSSSSPLQEESPPPRNKKILIESPSFSSINTVSVSPPPSKIHHSDHLQPTNPFLRSNPNSSFTTSTSPSLHSLPFIRTSPNYVPPFTLSENTSDINNKSNVNSVSCSKSSSVPVIRRCNSVPLTTSENSSEINNNVNSLPSTTSPPVVSFFNPKSPENFGSTLTPPSKPVTYLDRLNSFTGSCGSQKSAVEESPVPSKPPRPSSLYRSFSDVNPCTVVTPASTLNSDEMTTLTASGQLGQIHSSGSPVISDGDNPSSRRWKRMRKSLMEMNKWLNYIIQEQSKEDDAAVNDDADDDDEGEEKKIDNDQVQQVHETVAEENVTAERDGDAMKVRYVCSCGKHYQIAMTI